MKKGLTSGLVLLVLGLVAGFLLGVVNAITAPIIEANELAAKLEALEVFYEVPAGQNLQDLYDVEELAIGEAGIESAFVLRTLGTETVAAAVYSVAAAGYKSDVAMLIAIDADGTVRGYAFIGNGGTEGIGLVLEDRKAEFGMTGEAISAWSTAFDAIAGASVTSGGVSACFQAVAERIASEGLGA